MLVRKILYFAPFSYTPPFVDTEVYKRKGNGKGTVSIGFNL